MLAALQNDAKVRFRSRSRRQSRIWQRCADHGWQALEQQIKTLRAAASYLRTSTEHPEAVQQQIAQKESEPPDGSSPESPSR